ncbi:MAG: hypothetical protein ACOC7R_01555 [Planctomycetota bacterium]
MLEALRTPSADGEVLLLPDSDRLRPYLAEAAAATGEMSFDVAGVPAAELRRRGRDEIARAVGAELPAPWIATGHQSEMHHAGVWFKVAAIGAWARAAGGTALHVVTDLDAAAHVTLDLPRVREDNRITLERVPLAHPVGAQCPAQLPAPPREAIRRLARRAQPSGDGGPLDTWLTAVGEHDGAGTLAEWIADGGAAVNRSLGLDIRDAFASRLMRGRAYARFAVHIFLNARRMFEVHRAVLASHRRRHGITNPTQPVPDLRAADGALEMPLWAFRGDSGREPLFVKTSDDGVELRTPAGRLMRLPGDPDKAVDALVAFSDGQGWIAPRALTLTMFLRSFICDIFVHGTGGARYDSLGNALIDAWYGWRPPPFGVATATLRLDLPRYDVTPDDLAAARWRAHHLYHNPWLGRGRTDPPPVAERLHAAKTAAVRRAAALKPFAPGRAEAYEEIHRVNEQLRALLPDAQREAARRVARIEAQREHNRLADDRGYFFALMPRQKLAGLVEQARRWATAGTGER